MQMKKWRPGKLRCRLQRWGDFRREVATLIRLLGDVEGRFIIFSQRNIHRFVQFRVFEGGVIRGEVVSNKFLLKGERLTEATCRRLVELGWHRPAKTSPNFWSAWQPPPPTEAMVSLAVTTLRDAFGVASPNELEIETGDDVISDWGPAPPRGRGIKVKDIAGFDARGMRLGFCQEL